jgi:hypothetical protein
MLITVSIKSFLLLALNIWSHLMLLFRGISGSVEEHFFLDRVSIQVYGIPILSFNGVCWDEQWQGCPPSPMAWYGFPGLETHRVPSAVFCRC